MRSATHEQRMPQISYRRKKKTKRCVNRRLAQRRFFDLLLVIVLARALIFDVLSPFLLPYYLHMYRRDKKHGRWLLVISLLSSYTAGGSLVYLMCIRLILCVLCETLGLFERRQMTPILLAVIQFISHLTVGLYADSLAVLTLILGAIDALLTAMAFRVFKEIFQLDVVAKTKWTYEQMFSLLVFGLGILSGLNGFSGRIFNVAIIITRLLVLSLGYSGGMLVGATAGVVASILFSFLHAAYVSEVMLLAMLGLISGLLKGKKRFSIAILSLVTTGLFSLYVMDVSLTFSLIQTVIGTGLFMAVPKKKLKQLAEVLPTSADAIDLQQRYLRDLREVTSHQMTQFANVFKSLSESMGTSDACGSNDFCADVVKKACANCLKREWCLGEEENRTMENVMTVSNLLKEGANSDAVEAPLKACIKKQKVISVIKEMHLQQQLTRELMRQQHNAHMLVKDQLVGVSKVMNNFAKEVMKDGQHYESQERDIRRMLRQLGISVEKLTIYSLEQGDVDLELTIIAKRYFDEAVKLIAPVLSDVLSDDIVVTDDVINTLPDYQHFFVFKSARHYMLNIGVSHAAKGGGFISGDSYQTMDVTKGKHVLAISDGMGNGRKAQRESMQTLHLLKQILQSGMDEVIAIQSINQLLALRQNFDMYATLDLAMIDLQSGKLQCVKVGAATSFIKRKKTVDTLTSMNLPIGIIEDVEVDKIEVTLKEGDILIMMSDGIIEKREEMVQQSIEDLHINDPQAIADWLLDQAIIDNHQHIVDDMTVIVARLDRFKNKWQSIPQQAIEQYCYG